MRPRPTPPGVPRLACLLGLMLLSACASGPGPSPATASWEEHRARLEAFIDWTAKGKVALRSSEASESGQLNWTQRGAHTRVHLSGPIGMGATVIESDGNTLDIKRGDEHRVVDISSRDAVARNTGWDLPLAALPYWLKGVPAPSPEEHTRALDPQLGVLRQLHQDGWQVDYLDYDGTAGLQLPTRLHISRGDTRARVIIRQWLAGELK